MTGIETLEDPTSHDFPLCIHLTVSRNWDQVSDGCTSTFGLERRIAAVDGSAIEAGAGIGATRDRNIRDVAFIFVIEFATDVPSIIEFMVPYNAFLFLVVLTRIAFVVAIDRGVKCIVF